MINQIMVVIYTRDLDLSIYFRAYIKLGVTQTSWVFDKDSSIIKLVKDLDVI